MQMEIKRTYKKTSQALALTFVRNRNIVVNFLETNLQLGN